MKYLLLGLLPALFFGCSDIVFPDMTSEQARNARKGGWIPSFVPLSAVNVIEKHDIDTNRTVVSFEVTSPDWFDWVEENGSKIGYKDIESKLPPMNFWPRSIRSEFRKTIESSPVFFRILDKDFGSVWYLVKSKKSPSVFLFSEL